jgi:spore germination protein GerM
MIPGTRKQININLLIPFLVIALFFGITIWKKYRAIRDLPDVPQLQLPSGKRTAVLFFVADGTRLTREARELDPCNDDVSVCIKDVLEELVNGPVGEFDESLPDGTVINTVRMDGDQAGVDLNKTFVESLPSGSSAEMLAVYSIVDTVATNFPQITKVKISIDGDGKTLLHHLDLSDPLVPDYTLELPPKPPTTKMDVPRTSKK